MPSLFLFYINNSIVASCYSTMGMPHSNFCFNYAAAAASPYHVILFIFAIAAVVAILFCYIFVASFYTYDHGNASFSILFQFRSSIALFCYIANCFVYNYLNSSLFLPFRILLFYYFIPSFLNLFNSFWRFLLLRSISLLLSLIGGPYPFI